jgi:chromosome segregation ATPase
MDVIDSVSSLVSGQENLQRTAATQINRPQLSGSDPAEKMIPSDKVVISAEAKAKLSDESSTEKNQDALRELAGNGQGEVATEKTDVENIDDKIEELKEKVRELMQQLAQLKVKDDEQSMAQQKVLETQIAALNSQIMSLNSMKLEMIEQEQQ